MFHKNIPNNNKDIIRFLAKNFAGTKKVRNSILFCSVVIGIVAITMVFGISFGKIQAEEIRLIRENGAASSGRIEDGTEEQYAKLKQLDYIKQVGKSIFVGEATDISKNNKKTICNIVQIFLSNVRTHLCIHLSLFPFLVPVQRYQVFSMPAQIIEFLPFSADNSQSHWYMPASKNCSNFLNQPKLRCISFFYYS